MFSVSPSYHVQLPTGRRIKRAKAVQLMGWVGGQKHTHYHPRPACLGFLLISDQSPGQESSQTWSSFDLTPVPYQEPLQKQTWHQQLEPKSIFTQEDHSTEDKMCFKKCFIFNYTYFTAKMNVNVLLVILIDQY